ncbi:MAG: DUF5684 domain-containing protein [Chloroflexota bacterium]
MLNSISVLASPAFQSAYALPQMSPVTTIIYIVLALIVLAGYWMTFSKANKPGWLAIIPIVNVIVILQIAGKPWWWIILLLIPFLNIIIVFLVFIDFARAYGQGFLFALGLIFLAPIFICILGFGSADYIGA